MDLLEIQMALFNKARPPQQDPAPAQLEIQGQEVVATSPEGKTARMPLDLLLARVAAGQASSGPLILPDGVKSVWSRGRITIWVWESPPRVYNFDWIANDSPAAFGPGTTYRKVRLALPYLVVLAVFGRNEAGLPHLIAVNECFFRNAPLKRLDDELLYPALLNCSKFDPPDGRPLSWICTQHLRPTPRMRSQEPDERYRGGFEALRHCLLETAFNLSSDRHEAASWFNESRGVDPRVSTVEAWQEASAGDGMFVLEVPWLKTGHTLARVIDRIFKNLGADQARANTTAGLARIIFNQT
jgi:hypothetical protein